MWCYRCLFSLSICCPRSAGSSGRKGYQGWSLKFRLDLASAFAQNVPVTRASVTSPSIYPPSPRPTGSPNRTAELGSRDQGARSHSLTPNLTVSGSASPDPIAKNRRNRVFLSIEAWVMTGSLCLGRLNGGGRSRGRTRLSGEIPGLQANHRETARISARQAERQTEFPNDFEPLPANSLRSGAGNSPEISPRMQGRFIHSLAWATGLGIACS